MIQLVRPTLSSDKRDELESYLLAQWHRAQASKDTLVNDKYVAWSKNYYGIPAEEIRTIPWYKSSNFVVKIVRLFVEAFVARTLNLVFATNPLVTVGGFPIEQKEALEFYLDKKARGEWKFYELFNRMLTRGAKNGTVVIKVNQVEDTEYDVYMEGTKKVEDTIVNYSGPRAKVIPFDDIFFHPITACDISEVEITFHRVRYSEEMAMRLVKSGKWQLDEEDVTSASKMPKDIKREDEREQAGIYDRMLTEMQMVECHLKYAVGNEASKFYSIVAVICPDLNKMVDVYYNPYPGNYPTFYLYSPSPREDCIYGESWSEVLAQSQEEISQIHNDRRNSSFLASAPVFKRKSGSNIPNPSTNWYPGKVFDLDDMTDFEVVTLGRDTGDMINEELHVLSLAERLMGIGPIMQGASTGQQDKRGIYSTGGTLAVMGEGNSRQDSNIRDAREVLGEVARCAYFFQSHFSPDDPSLDYLDPKVATQIKACFQATNRNRIASTKFEIKSSTAGANREIEKSSLLQMANFLGEHSKTLLTLTPQVIQQQSNPVLRAMTQSVMELSAWMAKRLMHAYNEFDSEGILPDVRQILTGGNTAGAPPNVQAPGPSVLDGGAAGAGGGPVGPPLLQQLAQMGRGTQ